jgi:tetratricopeptide (TPR) repeat protein
MPLLRIMPAGPHVGLRFEPAEGGPVTAEVPFAFQQTPQEREDIRWYLEDYVRYPHDPAPIIATRVEQQMRQTGASLFAAVFEGSQEARTVWSKARPDLKTTRVEILSTDTAIPWEILREGENGEAIALTALSFVRAPPELPTGQPAVPARSESLRILLAICRPAGSADVPFRSVASRLIEGLRHANLPCECRVLRPPTFERLRQELVRARVAGRPYDIVHFDGHGVYLDQTAQDLGQRSDAHRMRGYLIFETEDGSEQYVNGTLMGQLLHEGQTPILLLNACRSAHAEPAGQPGDGSSVSVHQPFGSLAQEVSARGLVGVVAMRYNVFVETAAAFVEQTYALLSAGRTLGEAVAHARRMLAERSVRAPGDYAHAIQDWCVPEVYEARPWSIGARREAKSGASPTRREEDLVESAEIGFVGRDIALLDIDRALDSHAVVLLHGWAGGGKTAAAVEFARWYALTGGIEGSVAFVPLNQARPFAEILANVRLQHPKSALWICDGCERMTTLADRRDFLQFVESARQAKIKLVVTSRSAERSWVPEDAAHRVLLGPITLPECQALVRRLVQANGAAVEGEALRRLISFSFGNPMTLAGLVGQAIQNGVSTPEECQAFIERLRLGGFDQSKDRALRPVAESVTSSLASFSDLEQKQLSLLCLFRGFVNYEFFCLMGGGSAQPKQHWGLHALHGLSFEGAEALLDRAADQGLLASIGAGYYAVHPALCWAFRPLCTKLLGERIGQAYVKANVACCGNFIRQMAQGNNLVLRSFAMEQENLRHARSIAQQHGWCEDEITIDDGLLRFLQVAQRTEEVSELALELFRLVFDPQTKAPRPGRESHIPMVMEHLATMAENARDLESAEVFLGRAIDHSRPRLPARGAGTEDDSDESRALISELALEVYRRGQIRYARGDVHCLDDYLEAIELYQRSGLRSLAANAALDAGTAYLRLQSLRDLDAAEQWYLRASEWLDKRDHLGQANCYIQLGAVALKRREEAQTQEIALHTVRAAIAYLLRALPLLPEVAVQERAACHSRLGTSFRYMGDLVSSLEHSQEAMRLFDQYGDVFQGGQIRLNLANVLMEQGRYEQSAEYVREAVRQFKSMGTGASASVALAEKRLAWIEAKLGQTTGLVGTR